MLGAQRLVPRLPVPALDGVVDAFGRPRLSKWAFAHYLEIAPPRFAAPAPPPAPRAALPLAA
jgi:hypothetical protein